MLKQTEVLIQKTGIASSQIKKLFKEFQQTFELNQHH